MNVQFQPTVPIICKPGDDCFLTWYYIHVGESQHNMVCPNDTEFVQSTCSVKIKGLKRDQTWEHYKKSSVMGKLTVYGRLLNIQELKKSYHYDVYLRQQTNGSSSLSHWTNNIVKFKVTQIIKLHNKILKHNSL